MIGQACHGRSQSRGMGKAPNQEPPAAHTELTNRVAASDVSTGEEVTEEMEVVEGPSTSSTG